LALRIRAKSGQAASANTRPLTTKAFITQELPSEGRHNTDLVVPQFEFLFAISAARRKAAIASNSTEKCAASPWYTSIVPVGWPLA
jgi:hypothetical protein